MKTSNITMPYPPELDLERIKIEAQKAVWFYDRLDDACPYPFATVAGVAFKDAFLKAQAEQAQALAADTQDATHATTQAIPRI